MSYRRDSYRDRDDRGGSGFRDRMDPRCKVYVGNLPEYVKKEELEQVFENFGDLRGAWVARNPPGFAFIEFKDPRDADDAVYKLDGKDICGGRDVKVEIASSRRGRGGGGGYRGGGGRRELCYACNQPGHFARDCKYGRRPGDGERRGYRQSYDRRSPRYSRSRSRSPRPRHRHSHSKSRSPIRHSRSPKPRQGHSDSKSRSRSPKD